MAFIPFVGGSIEAIWNLTNEGIPGIVTMGFQIPGGTGPELTDLEAVAEQLVTVFWPTVQELLCASTTLVDITMNDLTSQFGLQYVAPVAEAGTHTGTAAPNNCCMCVTLQSGIRGRSFRGRNYWTGLPDAVRADLVSWAGGTVTQWTETYSNFIPLIASAGYPWSIPSRYFNKTARDHGIMTGIETVRANAGITTQRRRLT